MSKQNDIEQRENFGGLVDTLTKSVPFLPLLGFVFAFSYEWSFCYTLGMDMEQTIGISDIIRASALKVIPAIPIIFVGLWLGAQKDPENGKRIRDKALYYASKGQAFFIRTTIILIISSFLLLGVYPETSEPFLVVFISILILRHLFVFFLLLHGPTTAVLFSLTFFAIFSFASTGVFDANKIRSGNWSGFPTIRDEKKRIENLFSGGTPLESWSAIAIIRTSLSKVKIQSTRHL